MGIGSEIKGALIIAGCVAVVFGLAEALYHLELVGAEKTRKITHFGGGMAVLATPWLLHSAWTVALESAGFAAFLVGTRWLGLLPSVHAVRRRSRGAHYYPLSILLVFLLSEGRPLLFVVPILILALCDPLAALVGQELGTLSYQVEQDSTRTVEGSAAFFGLAYAITLVGLGLGGQGQIAFPVVLLVPLIVAMVATGVEAISTGGADNLLVPYAALLVLRQTLHAPPEELGRWMQAMVAMLLLGLVSFRQARLSATGFISLFLIGTASWCVGGLAWLLPLLMVYLVFLASRSRGTARADGVTSQAIFPLTALGLVSLALELHLGMRIAFPLFLASVAGNSAIAWLLHAEHRALPLAGCAAFALGGAVLPLAPLPLAGAAGELSPGRLALLAGAGVAAALLFRVVRRRTADERRARLIAVALVMALLAALDAGTGVGGGTGVGR